jgi:acyl-coenzyme A thioesterase PaaI-like protein
MAFCERGTPTVWHWWCFGVKPMNASATRNEFSGQNQNIRADAHPFCFVCSASNPMGLALRYTAHADGSVSTAFLGNCALEGYPGLLHGGVVAALLDGVMTNCLFARGIRGFTVELKVRYYAGVAAAEEAQLRAWLENETHGLFQLRAELTQNNSLRATATGKFMRNEAQT